MQVKTNPCREFMTLSRFNKPKQTANDFIILEVDSDKVVTWKSVHWPQLIYSTYGAYDEVPQLNPYLREAIENYLKPSPPFEGDITFEI